jgi:type II secretory pathway component PulC
MLSRPRLQRFVNRPPGLESQFWVAPFRSKAGDAGLRVFPTGRGRFLPYLGIRGGDVIFEINNVPVRSKLELVSAFSRMIERKSGTIDVLNQGKKEEREYLIR